MSRYAFDGENFMTPNIIYIRELSPRLAVEFSTGTGFDHEPIYGVTFSVWHDGRWQRTYPGPSYVVPGPESKMFHSRQAAESYIAEARDLAEDVAHPFGRPPNNEVTP